MSIPEYPDWEDGSPVNITAAAMDAMEWLRWVDRNLGHQIRQRHKLKMCISALDEQTSGRIGGSEAEEKDRLVRGIL